MIHHGQSLTFRLKSSHNLPRIHSQLNDFQRNLAAHRFRLFGQVNGTKAAFSDNFEQLVLVDERTNTLTKPVHCQFMIEGTFHEELMVGRVELQHRAHAIRE